MGDWSVEPWGNDEAADWYYAFWENCDFSMLINEINNFDVHEERFDSVRAACYLLETIGIVYIWPSDYIDDLEPILIKAINILKNMINPPDENWGFLDMWGNDDSVIEEVKRQISVLENRLVSCTTA
jgi:hypothetical protein